LSPKRAAQQEAFPCALRDDFLSPAEQSFCLVLRGVVTDQLVVCPKVALADLFFAKTGDARQNRICLNRIDRKHVDFQLCETKTLRRKLGIELDDRSHDRAGRQARDVFVNDVFAGAKLPLLRVPAKRGYAAAELDSLLRSFLTPATPPPSVGVQNVSSATPPHSTDHKEPFEAQEQAPPCPKCGAEMVLRTARNGANQGSRFWSCRNFPRCHSVVRYSSQRDETCQPQPVSM
jgi:hypothetical protein